MSLSNGHPYLAIPGPSVVPDAVQRAMHAASPNIYDPALMQDARGIARDLKVVAGTQHDLAMYISNGHGVWEAALVNSCRPGARVVAMSSGHFGEAWANMATGLGLDVDARRFPVGQAVPPEALQQILAEDPDHQIHAVLVVQAETSSGVRNDIAAMGEILRASGHPALLMVDCIASFGADRFEMDAWGVDVMISGNQKGLMMPPGMGFVFLGPRAAAARAQVPSVSHYWDWAPRLVPDELWQYFGGTPPTQHLFGLRAALDMILAEGLGRVWARHATLAQAVWAAVDCWGSAGHIGFNVPDPSARSHAVTGLWVSEQRATPLRQWLEVNTGVTLGIGLGQVPADGHLRVGHMGHVNAHMVLGVLGAMQAELIALDIPHGPGALDAAARVIAEGA